MAQKMNVEARTRTGFGSASVRRMRRAGRLPGILYGKDEKNVLVEVDEQAIEKLLQDQASDQLLCELSVDGGAPKMVMLADVQRDTLTGNILHMDFRAVTATTRLQVACPIELVGEPAGVLNEGGILEQMLFSVEVSCFPSDIPELLEVDVSSLNVGDRITIADLPLDPSKVEVTIPGDIMVATVHVPRVVEEGAEEVAGEAAAGTDEEPEILTEKKEDE